MKSKVKAVGPDLYKKGSIVPRRFLRAKSRHLQHLYRWGTDVEVHGNRIVPVGKTGAVFVFKGEMSHAYSKDKLGRRKVHKNVCALIQPCFVDCPDDYAGSIVYASQVYNLRLPAHFRACFPYNPENPKGTALVVDCGLTPTPKPEGSSVVYDTL